MSTTNEIKIQGFLNSLNQFIAQPPRRRRQTIDSESNALLFADFLSDYFLNRSLHLPDSDPSIKIDRGSIVTQLHPSISSVTPIALYLGERAIDKCLDYASHFADLRSSLVLHAAVRNAAKFTIADYDLESWLDQRIVANIFDRVSDLDSISAARTFVFDEFPILIQVLHQIDTFCFSNLVAIIEQRFCGALERNMRLALDEDEEDGGFSYILCQQPGSDRELSMSAVFVNLLLVIQQQTQTLQRHISAVLSSLLQHSRNFVENPNQLKALSEWLVPTVLSTVSFDDSISINQSTDQSFLCVFVAMVTGRWPDSDQEHMDFLYVLLQTSTLASCVYYILDTFNITEHSLMPLNEDTRPSWQQHYLSPNTNSTTQLSRILHHLQHNLSLTTILPYFDSHDLVSVKLDLNLPQLLSYFDPDYQVQSGLEKECEQHHANFDSDFERIDPEYQAQSSLKQGTELTDTSPSPTITDAVDVLCTDDETSPMTQPQLHIVPVKCIDQPVDISELCGAPSAPLTSPGESPATNGEIGNIVDGNSAVTEETGLQKLSRGTTWEPTGESGSSAPVEQKRTATEATGASVQPKPRYEYQIPVNHAFFNFNWRTHAQDVVSDYMKQIQLDNNDNYNPMPTKITNRRLKREDFRRHANIL